MAASHTVLLSLKGLRMSAPICGRQNSASLGAWIAKRKRLWTRLSPLGNSTNARSATVPTGFVPRMIRSGKQSHQNFGNISQVAVLYSERPQFPKALNSISLRLKLQISVSRGREESDDFGQP